MSEVDTAGWTPARLRRWRTDLGWTQRRAASELRMHLYAYRHLELGTRAIRPQVRLLAELIERRETPSRPSPAKLPRGDAELVERLNAFCKSASAYAHSNGTNPNARELLAHAEMSLSSLVGTVEGPVGKGCNRELVHLARNVQHLAFATFSNCDIMWRMAEEARLRKARRTAKRLGAD